MNAYKPIHTNDKLLHIVTTECKYANCSLWITT